MNVVNPKQTSNDFPETQNKSTNGRCGSSRTTFPGKRSSWVFSMWAPQLLETESTYHGAVLFLGDWWRLFSPNIIDSNFFPITGIQISCICHRIPIWYRSYIMNDTVITYDNQLLWNYHDRLDLMPPSPNEIWDPQIHSRGPFGATPLMRGMAPSAM